MEFRVQGPIQAVGADDANDKYVRTTHTHVWITMKSFLRLDFRDPGRYSQDSMSVVLYSWYVVGSTFNPYSAISKLVLQ